jgi:hypothetical protein
VGEVEREVDDKDEDKAVEEGLDFNEGDGEVVVVGEVTGDEEDLIDLKGAGIRMVF